MNLSAKLGKRQTEIAEHIGFGYSIKETAHHMGISIDTVKSTLRAIYAKIGIQKATELSKFVFCKRFDIPLSLCEPARRVIAIALLLIYISSLMEQDNLFARRTRRSVRTERITRRKPSEL